MSIEVNEQKLSFEAEVQQLLKLVTESLYSNDEIVLRELISNSSDALDKLRMEAIATSNESLYENDPTLKIVVDYDDVSKTLTVRDNGIGMSREEIIDNLGMIANSGTKAFKEALNQSNQDHNMIGQFGVGFYSAFVIADRVEVISRRAGLSSDQAVYWSSDGTGEYTVKNIERAARGTSVILYLKKDKLEFLENFKLRSIINKYSDHIMFPIELRKPAPVKDEKDNTTADSNGKTEEKDTIEDGEIVTKPEYETVNQAKAFWVQDKSEIKDDDYIQFYKNSLAHDPYDPLEWSLNKVEGSIDFTTLLYIPSEAPFDLWNAESKRGLKLYVKRVFIMDDAEHMLPRYLRFVRGIVDAKDLPLNVSRELLQSDKIVDKIRSSCVKRVLKMLVKMSKTKPEKFEKFWSNFGAVLKEGVIEDFSNKEEISELLRFYSTDEGGIEQKVSFSDYVSRMKSEQENIYYLIADNYQAAKSSPLLEVFRKQGIEVLLLTDHVDEWLVGHLMNYNAKQLVSIASGELEEKLQDSEESKEQIESSKQDFAAVVEKMKDFLKDSVKDVRLTHRLTDSPSCVVHDKSDMSPHMQRIMQAAGQGAPTAKPILELNPNHDFLMRLKDETDSKRIDDWAYVLLGQAFILEGEELANPADFVQRLNRLL